jgi:hypothetical protein
LFRDSGAILFRISLGEKNAGEGGPTPAYRVRHSSGAISQTIVMSDRFRGGPCVYRHRSAPSRARGVSASAHLLPHWAMASAVLYSLMIAERLRFVSFPVAL